MGVVVGVEVGRTTARAVVPGSAPLVMPSVIHVGTQLAFGDAAAELALRDPDRIARGLIDRVGDPVPLVLAGQAHAATPLLGAQVAWLAAAALAAAASDPVGARIGLVVPSGWGRFRHDAIAAVLPGVVPVPAALAAVAAAGATSVIDPAQPVTVVRVGGAGSRVTVLDAGSPEATIRRSVEHPTFSGGLLDDAIASLVVAMAGIDVDRLAGAELFELRRRCVAAKESLSVASSASIDTGEQSIRVTRGELEAAAGPALGELAATVAHTAAAAGVALRQVLVHGGVASMPMVAATLSERLGCAVSVVDRPATAAAAAVALLAAPTTAPIAVAGPTDVVAVRIAGSTLHLEAEVGAVAEVPALGAAVAAFALPEDPAPIGTVEADADPAATVVVVPSPPTTVELCVVGGIDVARRFGVSGPLVVGRSRSADVRIDDARLSRRHVEIAMGAGAGAGDGVPVATDLGSSNGTFVEGAPVVGRTELGAAVVEAGSELFRCRPLRPVVEATVVHRWPRVRRVQPPRSAEELRADHPDVDRLLTRALLRRGDLWERRPWQRDFLMVRAGWCDADLGDGPEVRQVPFVLRLPSVGRLRVGAAPAWLATGVLRQLVAQLVLLHGPDDLAVELVGSPSDGWDWVERLPHAGGAGRLRVRVVGDGPATPGSGCLDLVAGDSVAALAGDLDLVVDGVLGELTAPLDLVVGPGRHPARPDVLADEQARQIADALSGLRLA